jgi:hypothetical protein
MAFDPQGRERALQSKTKPARFINGVHLCSLIREFGHPMEEGFLCETLRRLGIGSSFLLNHDIIILVHINPELDDGFAPIKLRAGSLV